MHTKLAGTPSCLGRRAAPSIRRTALAALACASLAALAGSKTMVVLHQLTGSDAVDPRGTMIVGPDGALYGTGYWGGSSPDSNGAGTLFRQVPGGGFSVIHEFDFTNGSKPNSGLTLGPDGRMWGTGSQGGAANEGVIFTIDATGTYQVHYAFDGTNGGFVYPGVTFGPDGMLYGATTGGGAHSHGTLYRFDPASGNYTVLHTFVGGNTDGEEPYASLALASDGNLYGSTFFGSQGRGNKGVIFRLTPAGDFSVLHSLSYHGTEGCQPTGPLVDGGDGKLYGTTNGCGAHNLGTVFSIDRASGSLDVLWNFAKGTCGLPWEGLTPGPDGRFYGTATYGGSANAGCVFSISKTGDFKAVHRFTGGDPAGGRPDAGVTFIGKNMYGVTGSATWQLVKSGKD